MLISSSLQGAAKVLQLRLQKRSIRARTFLLVLTPLVSLVGLYAFATTITAQDANTLARATSVRNSIADPIGFFTSEVQQERLAVSLYLAQPSAKGLAALRVQEAKTDAELAALRAAVDSPATQSASAQPVKAAIAVMLHDSAGLPALRDQVASRAVTMARAQSDYSAIIAAGYQTIDQSVFQMPNVTLANQAGSVLRIAEAEDYLLQAQALLVGDEAAHSFSPADHAEFGELTGEYQGLLTQALSSLQPSYRAPFQRVVASPAATSVADFDDTVINAPAATAKSGTAQSGTALKAEASALAAYSKAVGTVAGGLGTAGFQAGQTLASALHAAAEPIDLKLIVAGGLGLLAILVSIVVSVWIGRRFVRELAALRQDALELATKRLPKVIARLNAGEEVDVAAETPFLSTGRDEIGQVRQAFNAVQRAAIEAAAGQAMLRAGVSTVFRNLARRSQSLLHQQLILLDAMERRADNPAELERLFRIDHLTTQMRRNAEGLVVLAGDQPTRSWTDPVPMIDVMRAAVAEVVSYSRIRTICVSQSALKGHAVADVIHLLAELADNATSFSPPETTVRVYGSQGVNGFAVEIEDRGLAMSVDTMARLNAELAQPTPFNPAKSEQLGIYVTAQLAQRHGIRVTLRESPFGGTTAIVFIPMDQIVTTSNSPSRPAAPAASRRNGVPAKPAEPLTGRHASRDERESRNSQPTYQFAAQPADPLEARASVRKPSPWDIPEWNPRDKRDRVSGVGIGPRDPDFQLPQRTRLASLAPQLRGRAAAAPEIADPHSPDEIRDAMSAFQLGSERGRAADGPEA
jgi:signal transduction histidine kinase